MKSMTGYGSGTATFPGGRVQVELRTVNHRFLEIKMPLPREFLPWESELRAIIAEALQRGRVEMTLTRGERAARTYTVEPNLELARAYRTALTQLATALEINTSSDLSFLTTRPDLFLVSEQPGDIADEITAVKAALAVALTAIERQRRREGTFLQKDFRTRLALLEKTRRAIAERSRIVQEQGRQRLQERVAVLTQGLGIDPSRILQEIITLTQKSDITEEIVRLHSHLKALTELARSPEPVGKRFEFLLQEVQREINTIGAKSDDVEIRHAVVEAKEEVEKMREQVQNIE